MRLLHTSTFKLESFEGETLPPYAILSHTWGDEEITFQELQHEDAISLLSFTKAQMRKGYPFHSFLGIKKGFLKIAGCALQAKRDGFNYIWTDTICIDKSNSTELSEAINSMYHWYKNQLCYVYLADVPHTGQRTSVEGDSAFAKSRWFTRGWTLQELIAPSSVIFFDDTWQIMGTRWEFRDFIAERTGISRNVLDGEVPARSSIAKRMSWASQRETTRVEDLAYCLMGLFGVNMPLIYGEKHNAFLRLQAEIMKISDDHSLFAWKSRITSLNYVHSGLLATSPSCFAESSNIEPFSDPGFDDEHQPPFSMTNRGISISLPVLQVEYKELHNVIFAVLGCQDLTDARGPLGIFLFRNSSGLYRRCYPNRLIPAVNIQNAIDKLQNRSIYITQNSDNRRRKVISPHCFYIPELSEELLQHGLTLNVFVAQKNTYWNPDVRLLHCSRGMGALIFVGLAGRKGRVLLVGVNSYLHARSIFDHLELELNDVEQHAQALLLYQLYGPRGLEALENIEAPARRILDVLETEYWRDTPLEGKRDSRVYQGTSQWGGETSTALLTIGERTRSEIHQSNAYEVSEKVNLKISANIEEDIIGGQKMFVVHIRGQDGQRDPEN